MLPRRLRLTFVNFFQRHAGAERCLNDLCHGFRQRGHDVTLVVGRPEKETAEAGVQRMQPHRLEWLWQRGWHRLLGVTDTLMLSPLWRAWRLPAFRQADVIHIHNLHGGFFNLWALPILAGHRPLVMSLHDMWLLTGDCIYSGPCQRWQTSCGVCPVMRRPYRQRGALGGGDLTRLNLAIKRTACRLIDRERLVLAPPSRWLANLARQSHLQGFSSQVVPYGIDLTLFRPLERPQARRRLGLPDQALLLAAVAGNWDNPYKGGDLLLELACRLHQQRLGQIVVVGRMSQATRQNLLDQNAIVREGLQGSEVVHDVFAACDAALVLSKEENLPYVVMEALACGCPPIACRSGGIPEMFTDGQHGWLVPAAARPEDLLECIRELQADGQERCQQRRQAARLRAEKCYGLQTMLDAYEQVYQRLLGVPEQAWRPANGQAA